MRFYNTTQHYTGDRETKDVSKGGHRGLKSHTRGWERGIKVTAAIYSKIDVFNVDLTCGSDATGPFKDIQLGYLQNDEFILTLGKKSVGINIFTGKRRKI